MEENLSLENNNSDLNMEIVELQIQNNKQQKQL